VSLHTDPHPSEQAVLGAMLLSPDAIAEAAAVLTSADFAMPMHGAIFDAVVDLWRCGARPDTALVLEHFKRHGGANGTDAYALIHLMAEAPGTRISAHLPVVAEYATRRRLWTLAEQLKASAHDLTRDVADTVDAAQVELSVSQMPTAIVADDVVTLDEFCARLESPLSWVVPGLIDVEDRIIIVAPEGVGKSMVARWLAVSAGQGIHPFTGDPIDAPNTLLVDLENPSRIVRSKVRPMLSLMRARRGEGYAESRTWIWHRPGGINLRTRAGAAELDAVCRKVKPRLVCLGPLYKAYRGDPKRSDHDNASDVAQVFDDLRTRHGFGLVLEHHAPLQQGAFRDLRPFGSLLWSQWPEVGIKLIPDADDPKGHTLLVDFYRGLRDERPWPKRLTRGTSAPWVASWDDDWRAA